jgi:hypothetical protein
MGTTSQGMSRNAWVGVVGAALVLLALVLGGVWFLGNRGSEPALTEFTPVSGTPDAPADVATPPEPVRPPSTPVPHEHTDATPADGATPQSASTLGVPEDACMEGCLLRAPNTSAISTILGETGERPSYQTSEWVWSVVSKASATRLDGTGEPVHLVHDSPETLYLYATRLPDGMTRSPAVAALGEVLDSVDGHSIVRVEAIPPVVKEIVAEKIWIEKLRPAAPANDVAPAGTGEPIAELELGVLLPQVDVDNIWMTVTDLQGMSSSDGTGIGTRQYSQPGNVMTAEYLFTRLESYGLDVWYEDFVTWEGFLVSNVIGEIGGTAPEMIYGVMAHIDSTAESFDEAPGADDNASGVAGTLEIARILAGYELEHTVHIIFVNAEETMIIGAMAYADGIVQNGVPIEGIFNMDTIGNPTHGNRLILNSGPQSAWMSDLMIRINNGYGLGQDIRVYQSDTIIADDTMLRRQGIEAVLVARLLADDYTVHHTSADTIENMSFDNTVTATQLVLLSIGALVQ